MSRNKRRSNSDVTLPTGTIPSALSTGDFVRARRTETVALARELREHSGTRLPWQTLPPHLRRRTMSHSTKKLPVRLRSHAQRLEEQSGKPKGSTTSTRHRKAKRRPKILQNDHERRKEHSRWLETHIWHAKRMHMSTQWGIRVALQPTSKGIRFNYGAASRDCVIHDASYYTPIIICGPPSLTTLVLRAMVPPTAPIFCRASRSGQRAHNVILYSPYAYPRGALCPALVIYRPCILISEGKNVLVGEGAEQGNILLWVHPAASREVMFALEAVIASISPEQFFESIGREEEEVGGRRSIKGEEEVVHVYSLEGELIMFELSGPQSTACLSTVLQPYPSSSITTPLSPSLSSSQIWSVLAAEALPPANVPPCVVLGLQVCNPSSGSDGVKGHESRNQWPPPKDETRLLNVLTQNWSEHTAYSSIWKSLDNYIKEKEKKEEKEKDEEKEKEKEKDKEKEKEKEKERMDEAIGGILVHRSKGLSRGFGAGWTLILPKGTAMTFWPKLIFAGARPIGLRERRWGYNEQKMMHFPEDFPDTVGYCAYALQQEQRLVAAYSRRPPAKRVNYDSIGTQHPFFIKWSTLFSEVNLSSINNNTTSSHKLPYCVIRDSTLQNKLLSKETISSSESTHILSERSTSSSSSLINENILIPVCIRMVGKGRVEWNSKICLYQKEYDITHNIIPKVIGYITSNQSYSLIRGCGWGLGFCCLSGMYTIKTTNTWKVLVCSPKSTKYYLATISII